ncbi:MAG TPA: hypothetical protein VMS98_09665 [Thermoanaerobaculia bacterium]|nr:hypothetical protein [Thermoanaerobaculia bacterium]
MRKRLTSLLLARVLARETFVTTPADRRSAGMNRPISPLMSGGTVAADVPDGMTLTTETLTFEVVGGCVVVSVDLWALPPPPADR